MRVQAFLVSALLLAVAMGPTVARADQIDLVSAIPGTPPLSAGPNGTSSAASVSADGRFVAFSSTASNLVATDLNGTTSDIFLFDADTGTTTLVTSGGDSSSFSPSISADGRFVSFQSSASNLVATDPNGNTSDIFLFDADTGTTTLVTSGGNNGSVDPSISADGRYVAFESNASNLVATDPNGTGRDIFLFDADTGTTTLVTSGGNNGSFDPSISADGRYVAFQSGASNLVATDPNGNTPDIFLFDADTGTTTLVTSGGNNGSVDPSISADGRFVAFQSSASNLVATDPNGSTGDIFLFDADTGTTTLVTSGGNSGSFSPWISADGRFVAFVSSASNLVATDPNGNTSDIFLFDADTGTTTLVTPGADGFSAVPSISADGRFVAFVSGASNLVATDPNGNTPDIFLFDADSGSTSIASIAPPFEVAGGNRSSLSPSISADGRYVAFRSDASNLVATDPNGTGRDIFLFDADTGTTTLVTSGGDSGSDEPSVSADGRFVAFASTASNLVATDPNGGTQDIFLFDRDTGTTTLVTSGGDSGSDEPSVSADGRFVAFASSASNLVATDPNGTGRDIFLFDADTGTTTLVTSGGNNGSVDPSISADGRFVAFQSSASNLVATDPNGTGRDIFLFDADTGTTTLVTSGGDSGSDEPSVSADGRFVAFASTASNLVATDPNGGTQDIFLFDGDTGTTTLVTSGGNSNSFAPSISADGGFVAFWSTASNLVASDPNGNTPDIFLFDADTGTTALVTSGGNSDSFSPSISANGKAIAFTSGATNLANDGTLSFDVFLFRANETPVADAQSLSVDEDTPLIIALTGSDAEGDPLTYAIASNPTNGIVTGTPPSVTYTPNAGFVGADSFTFAVSDGLDTSVPATISITVNSTNADPVATPQSVTTLEETPLTITLSGTDADGDTLSFTVETLPSNGTLAGQPPTVSYQPNMGYVGPDVFTFTAQDGVSSSVPAAITIAVTANNSDVFCGDPSPNPSSDLGLFLWQDCVTGGWFFRIYAGGERISYNYLGRIESDGALTNLLPVNFESNDQLDVSDPSLLTYDLRVFRSGFDGLNFRLLPGREPVCFTPEPNAPDTFLGSSRVLLDKQNINLRTGLECPMPVDSDGDGLSDAEEIQLGTDPNMADSDGGGVNDGFEVGSGTDPLDGGDDLASGCGLPPFSPGADSGYYLGQDCDYPGPGRRYEMIVTGGGLNFQRYRGELLADVTLSPVGFDLEAADHFDTVSGDGTVDFDLGVSRNGIDGFFVVVPDGATTCFDPQTAGRSVFLGAGGQRLDTAFSLETFGPCDDGGGPPPDQGPQCGEPIIEPTSNPGLYLWQECGAVQSEAIWEGRVVGGGGPFRRYRGNFTAPGALVASGTDLESADTLDSTPGDGVVDFDLRVAGTGVDKFQVLIPQGTTACVNPTAIPGDNLFVGRNKLQRSTAFNTEDLGACN